jgi:hypothetical protein
MATRKRSEVVPGVVEAMPGLPGPSQQFASEPPPEREPVIAAPNVGGPLPEAASSAFDPTAEIFVMTDESIATPDGPAAAPNAMRKYRVWAHGDLHRDGMVYGPGAEIELLPSVADGIACLELVE